MKISLITVTLNSDRTLRDTIRSVLSQTYPDIEYIIVDGLSNDRTLDIIKEFQPCFNGRLRWLSEKDEGLYDAMNKGFLMATGEIIGIINSDDLFSEKTAIEKVMRCFEENAFIDCVYADLYYVKQTDINKIIRYWITGKQRNFNKGWHPAHPTFYVKKDIYMKHGLFDLNYKLAADFELMLRLIEKVHISMFYLEEPLVRMRIGGVTNNSLKNIGKANLECIRAFKKNNIKISVLYPFYRLLPKIKQYFQ